MSAYSITQTRKSKITADRRKYPREPKGEKNEWKAMVDHYTEAGNQAHSQERNYKLLKEFKQNQTFEKQMKERNEIEEKDKRLNSEIEHDILMRDIMAERLLRQEEEQRKLELRNKFKTDNQDLMRIKQEKDEREKLENLKLEHKILRNDIQGDDLNFLRAQKRINERKKIFLENHILQDKKSLYSNSPSARTKALSSFSVPKSIMYKSEGDIFDAMFGRPIKRQNYYDMLNQDQKSKIGDHRDTALRNKVGREVEKEMMVRNGILMKQRENEIKDYLRFKERKNKVDSYQNSIKQDYKTIQSQVQNASQDNLNYLRSMAQLREAERRELSMQDYQKKLYDKLEKDNYRNILRKQMDIKNYDHNVRKQMSRFEKKVNYEDLQAWKARERDIYTHSVPGLHPTIDKNVAKRVLNMFGRDSKELTVPERVVNKNIQRRERKYIKRY